MNQSTIFHDKKYTIGRIGELLVLNKFQELGFNFQCNVEKDYPHDFDFLVNGYRIEIKTSSQNFLNSKYEFGRWIFNYSKEKNKFDFLICIGLINIKKFFLIIPKEKIKGKKAIAIYPFSNTKNWKYYSQFINRWDFLKTN